MFIVKLKIKSKANPQIVPTALSHGPGSGEAVRRVATHLIVHVEGVPQEEPPNPWGHQCD